MKSNKFTDLLREYFSTMRLNTLESHKSDLRDFCRYLHIDCFEDAVNSLIMSPHSQANLIILHYKIRMREAGLKPSTINRRLSTLRTLVRKANALGFIHWTLDVSNEKADACKNSGELGVRHIRKMFTISGNQKNSAKAARDICVLRLLYDLALKRSAIVRLDFKDVDLIKGQIAVDVSSIQGKKLKKLPGKTREALENWIKLRGRRDGPLFTNFDRAGKGKRLTGTSVYRIVRQIGNEIGVQTRPNGFRRAAITCAVKKARSAGLELEEIIAFSDHTSKKSLSDYQEREKRIQERVSRLIAI